MVITGSETTEDDDDKPLLDSMKTKQNLNATANEMDIGSQLKCSILPLLQSQPTCNLTKLDVIALVKSITKLEPYILDFSVSFNPEYAPFFSSFVALSANCIVINAGAIPKSRIQLAASGCSILLKYLLQCLQISEDKVMLIKNQTIGLIQGLCDDVAPLMKSDVISLCAILKSSKIPPHLLPKQNLDRQNSQTTKLTRPDSEDVKEPKRMRLDHTCESLVEQLITPILDVNKKEYQDSEKNIISGFSGLSPSSKATLLSKNLFCLQQLGGATVLLDFVLSLNTVHNYIQPVLAAEEGAPLKLPSTVGDAFAIVKTCKTLLKEYDVMWRVLSLPILEPLTEDKLNKVITIIHTCLYISLSLVSASSLLAISGTSVNKGSVGATASGASKDEIFSEDSDNYLVSEIIDTSLEIYRRVTLVMKNSLRVGGQCCQNTHLFACWLLLSGVKYILNMSPYKSTHKNEDSATSSKGKQGYTTLCIPLVSHALKNLTALLDDLKFETGLTNVGIRIEKLTGSSSGSFKHNKFGCYSAWQRIEMLMSNINVTSLLFSIASVSYRKAGMLRLMKHNMQQQQQSASIAAASSSSSHEQGVELTPTNQSTAGQISDIDDECCFSSDDSSRDEDSEPILGQLFKENDRDEPRDQESHRNKPRSPSYTIDNSDKREPHRHLSLALQIFELFNTRFVCSELESIRTYLKATLNDAQVIIIANIIKDLDRESALPSAGFYSEFSRTLSSFVHNLIATESLSSDYQTLLLVQLGVNPSASANSLWPLHIPPRTLSVLAQVLLLRNRKDKDELRSDHGAPCLFLWQNLLNHLKSLILESTGKERKKTTSTLETNEMHDLNVEHAQLLLFIFHNLKLLQRKNVLLMVSHTIVEISKCVQKPLEDYKILFIARILHFFEYMMKNLYEPPHALIEQIDNNLLKFQTITAGRREKDNNKESASGQSNKSFFSCRSIEENYIKHNCSDKVVLHPMKPRFYYLMNVDASSTKDVPKLDGMALNFVLVGISDMLYDMQYDDLYDALVRLLLIGNQVDAYDSSNSTFSRHHFSYFGVCSTQYCFNIVWRLFLQMPPSLGYLQSLGKGNLPSEQHKILHAVIWIPRLTSNKWFYLWTRDALVKLLQNNSAVEAENLLKSVVQNSGSVVFSVRLLNNYISKVLSSIDLQSLQTFKPHELPKLFDMFVLETLVAKTMVALDMCFNLNEHSFTGNRREADNAVSPPGTIQEAKLGALELLPSTIRLITLYYSYIRWSILRSVSEEEKDYNDAMLLSYNSLLKVTSSKSGGKVTSFTLAAVGHLPKALTKALDKWNSLQVETASSPPWKNETSSNTVPSEVFISNIVNFHFNNLSSWPMSESSIVYFNGSLKRLTHTLLRFGEEIFIWALGILTSSNHHQAMIFDEFAKVVIPLNLDASLDSFYCYCSQVIDPIWGNKESDDYYTAVYVEVLSNLYDLLVKHTQHTSEKILVEAVKFMESLLDAPAGQAALEKFFCDGEGIADGSESRNLLSLLKAAVADNLGSSYATSVLKFLSKLFEQTEKNPDTVSLVRLCTSLSCLSNSDSGILQSWLSKIICAREENGETNIVINQENRSHLQNLTSYIVKENSTVDENVAYALLSALIPMSSHILSTSPEVMGFPELMIIMATLAGAGAGTGHISLIKSVVGLLETCKNYLFQKDVLEKLERNVTGGRHQVIMESACFMLSYLADVFEALKLLVNDSTTFGRPSSPVEGEIGAIATGELDSDWVEDITCADDDESTGEESDEDSLCNKLCTFTVTQKEFMNQHWYHCHTCKMVDGMGVCTVCARVCHKDHDVTYAKYGSFFCDCGAKTDGSCQALMKRVPSTNAAEPSTYRLPAYSNETDVSHALPSSLRRRSSSVDKGGTAGVSDESSKRKSTPESQSRHQMLARQLLSRKNEVISLLSEKNVSGIVLELLQHITPSVMVNCQKFSPVGCSVTARKELSKLHTGIQRLETSDSLMVPTLGSQEGAFENVRLNYSGEQGQTIRQLISTNVVRRVAMCALTSPYGKRQHLAVSHEKGKITLLQLSALLKQADSSKRKLTLTRLVSAPIPFTALSVAANPCNEDLLAVCGLKDCHILTFNQSGHVSAHVGLQPQLEAGNYVIKPVWLPGEQTKLALVTADFVKIYDLSASVTNPEYFYLLPSGKIRDVTFVFTESGSRYLLIISSMGYIYCQIMNEQSCARNGHFYVTTILEVRHNEIKETTGGFINSGGVSIYYSHAFQLLFFSYVNGKSVVGPLKEIGSEITNLFLIEIRSNGASNNNGSSKSSKDAAVPQPLCQWSEVPGHPGLILAMCQQSNNPVIFMVKPDAIVVQKIKFLTVKAKITDMVALRHATSPGEMRTTLILLCEDGSLRIYMAAQDTNYWLRPTLNTNIMFHGSGTASASSKLSKKKKSSKSRGSAGAISLSTSGSGSYPVDFFEHCTALNDVEFGGNDVLHVYNTQQLKNRLNTVGMYVASTKPVGFTIEVINNDPSMVMVGVRILVGTQDINKAPSCIDMFERSVRVYLTRSRWYDFPFTREESLMADKKFSIFFGASGDSSNVTMVDSIKVYGKTKESLSWPEDENEYPAALPSGIGNCDVSMCTLYGQQLSSVDRLLSCSLEVLDGAFTVNSIGLPPEEKQRQKQKALEIATSLLTLPFPILVQKNIKYLLLTLHENRALYNNHRDSAILNYVVKSLIEGNKEDELDGEAFYRLIFVTRSIANSRPNNLIKFGECLSLAKMSSEASRKDPVDIEMTTFTSNQKSQSLEISGSQSCYELSGPGTKNEATNVSKKQLTVAGTPRSVSFSEVPTKESNAASSAFITYLNETFWKLYSMRPSNPLLPTVAPRGLVHIDATVQALVEIIHAFTLVDVNNIDVAAEVYMKLFLCKDPVVSFGAKQALVRVLRPKVRKRKVFIPSPPHCETPSGALHSSDQQKVPSQSLSSNSDRPSRMASQGSLEVFAQDHNMAGGVEQQFDLIEGLDEVGGAAGGVEELMVGPSGQFAPLLDLPVDADDEAMVELAIALSLQDQQVPGGAAGANNPPHRVSSLDERGHFSDTTASAAASDDEGSTAATDGSTLRTSPVINEPEQVADGVGSESGASGAESIIGEHLSGRSSAYGEDGSGLQSKGHLIDNTETNQDSSEFDMYDSNNQKLHNMRILLLEKLVQRLPEIGEVGGVNSIPMMQVILMLSTDLDNEGERDKAVLHALLAGLVRELRFNQKDLALVAQRTPTNEVKLILMRLLSILMSRTKITPTASSTKIAGVQQTDMSTMPASCSVIAAQNLIHNNCIDACYQILYSLLNYWKTYQQEIENSKNTSTQQQAHPSATATSTAPIKARSLMAPPDMSPFFLKLYVKSHGDDVFELYTQLLTEMALRLPYQIKKLSTSIPSVKPVIFQKQWLELLCDYMMIQLTPYVRKHVRKLLSFICGSKEKYRQIRDFHALDSHMKEIRRICKIGGFTESSSYFSQAVIINLSYDSTISLIEHLKACCEIASSRVVNWQKFCQKEASVLPFFIQTSFLLDEGVSPVVLQLLQLALCAPVIAPTTAKPIEGGIKVPVTILQGSNSVSPTYPASAIQNEQQALDAVLARQLILQIDSRLLSQFIQCFLLESNSTSLRWQAHSLIFNLYKSFEGQYQEQLLLLETLWSLWHKVPSYGRKAVQFVDLLGYFTLKINTSEDKQREYTEKALSVLRQQNKLLMNHPNSAVYNTLQTLVEFDGYYLESEPCLVCNNPEVNYSNMKLSSVKVDSRFTTTTHIVKLVGSLTITKISLRISDIKRSKMVKTLNLYYNNRAVHSVVELKNKSNIWHKAKKCNLSPVQTEVKIEFTLPIVACNLMIEYGDFYENIQASSETLQCPRCSASVAANPGVCGNCGENVFQCHKCRAINYDEKDPFLCNSCGFCKYAKFDYILTAKPTCAVDPIENEDDRKKTVQTINTLLEKADRVYKTLIANKPFLEVLLFRIQEHGFLDKVGEDLVNNATPNNQSGAVGTQNTGHVNKVIHQVAQKYCGDCKTSFDELSKIIQKVLASRKELVDYDNRQRERNANPQSISQGATRRDSKVIASLSSASGRCYGCASATTENCITLLKALTTVPKYLDILSNSGLLKELLNFNLKNGKSAIRHEVRHLLCTLTNNNPNATAELNNMIMDKITTAFQCKYGQRPDLSTSIRHEIALLVCSFGREDNCWEQRLKCVMQLFLISLSVDSPAVLEAITLPCLKLLISLIKPEPPASKKFKDKSVEQLATVMATGYQINVDLHGWLNGDPRHSFKSWQQRTAKKSTSLPVMKAEKEQKKSSPTKHLVRQYYLMEKFGLRWKSKVLKKKALKFDIVLQKSNWLRSILFNRFSRTVRLFACQLVEALFQIPSRRREIIDVLTSYLDELGSAGEFSEEFFMMYHSLVQQEHWKYYLALQGVLQHLGTLITKEIDHLNELEETTLNSDLTQGIALKMLIELLSLIMEVKSIKQHYKSRLVAFVLNGYLSLRKLVVQRTKIIDEAQETLLELLEEMTSGNETETASFMSVCVVAINKCRMDDLRTPVFIFERLCSIIYPEENDTPDFYITLEKDPQQEDFLQGRMLGNPYSSNEQGMGPLMRDIKNKICQDCELVALLEDDSGMELLVRNKIISLDLPVKEVYKKVWCAENNESDNMRIVYRMRGLMGDATEEFVETLDSNSSQNVDNEVVYRMANVMSRCGGIQVMLQRLSIIKDLSARSRPLLLVLLKLFGHCINVSSCRKLLIQPSLNAIAIKLKVLQMFALTEGSETIEGSSGKPSALEQLLQIMEKILAEASEQSPDEFDVLCKSTCGTTEDIEFLLSVLNTPKFKSNQHIIQLLLKIIPLLTVSENEKIKTLLDHFTPYLNFKKFDYEHTPDDDFSLDCFAILVNGIPKNGNGNRLKDCIVGRKIVSNALEYLTIHAPATKSLLAVSDEWKEFTQRPALKYVLRILTGLSSGHEPTQLLVSADSIPVIHGLEQVSSDSHVGSLAEILLESLLKNPTVAKKIQMVRKQTREEKKRLAMAVRQKQLGELGMRANEKGQVTASSSVLKQVEDLGEEQGLTCIICREGYKFQPTKVIGIYTFTKKCNVEPFESKPRKTVGYSTVTHFNVVHVDCHMAAVRHARGRDEWESAALQNANTRCNGLLPLWGPSVQESAFASALARHNAHLQESTGHRDINYASTIHDLKLLLLKFASEESFSVDTGGGGHQSNIHLIPYLIHMALYVVNSTRTAVREHKKVVAFLELPKAKWVENAYEAEGPFYFLTMFVHLNPPTVWIRERINLLRRVIVLAHARYLHPKAVTTVSDKVPKEYTVYKAALTFFALIDGLYNILFKNVYKEGETLDSWTFVLADFIRNNDQLLMENGDRLLRYYEQDVLTCQTFEEYCDVVGLLTDISDPQNFIANTLLMI